jgi:signal transduction histidine kinase
MPLPSTAALLLLCVLSSIVPIFGQEIAPAPLGSIAYLRELSPEALEKGPPVRLEGVVVFSGLVGFTLHDGSYAIQVAVPEGQPRPSFSEKVSVEGLATVQSLRGRIYPMVRATAVERLGIGDLPEAPAATVGEIAAFRHWEQWVKIEAVVLDQSWSNGEHHLLVGGPDAWATLHVRNSLREEFPPGLLGTRIRVTGTNQGYDHSPNNALMVQHPGLWERVGTDSEPSPVPAFGDLAAGPSDPLGRVSIRGRVLATAPGGEIFVRDEAGGAARVTGFTPLPKPSALHGEASSAEPPPALRPGDEIEATGLVASVGDDVWLRFCRIEKVGEGTAPSPLETSFVALLSGGGANQLVQISGRLAERHEIALGGGAHRNLLLLEQDGRLLRCQYDARRPGELERLQIDDLVRTVGIFRLADSGEQMRLVVSSADEIISLGVAPVALLRRLWLWGGLGGGAILLLAAWGLSLKRSMLRSLDAEREVRDLNATLEERVRARTGELETARRELDRSLAQEKELNELKSRFVAMVSHEFRTPLGVTMSALELLRHHRSRLPEEKLDELFEDIFSSTLRMSGMMEQILALGRVEAGKASCRPLPLDLPAICTRIVEECVSASGRQNPVNLHFEGELVPVALDEALLRHILGNLVSNALKYTPGEGEVSLRCVRAGASVEIVVADRGIGIPEEDQARLFEAFHRASNVGEVSGTGLGLLLVKRCVELHRGEIRLRSAAGEGTAFTVLLPVGGGG